MKFDEIFYVFSGTILFILGLFIGFIIKHEKEHKKEIHKTNNNKDRTGQLNKSGDDVASRTSATSTTPATSTERQRCF